MKILNSLLCISTGVVLTSCGLGNWLGWDTLPQGQYFITITNVIESDGVLGGCDGLIDLSDNTLAQVNSQGQIRVGGGNYSSSSIDLNSNPCFTQTDESLFDTNETVRFNNCKTSNPTGPLQMNGQVVITNTDTGSLICSGDIQLMQFNNI